MHKPILAALLAATVLMPLAASAETLPKPAQAALERALQDEYHAEAFYAAVMDKFGRIRPFRNIIRAERKHASALAATMSAYGIPVPENKQLGSREMAEAVPATIGEACKMGVEAEIANRDLYRKELLPAVAGHRDIEHVFNRLSAASDENHLPAFQRCMKRN